MSIHIGLQITSVKYMSPSDICSVIRDVGQVGYEGVEFARGFYGKTVVEIKTALDEAGLVAISDHVFIDLIRKDLQRVIYNATFLGMKSIGILRGFDQTRDLSDDEIKAYTDELSNLSEAFYKSGVQAMIHSSTSFYQRDINGITLFERVLNAIDPRFLHAQIDTAWALCGGENPADFIRKFAGRVESVHIKDFHPPLPKGNIYEIRDQASFQNCAIGDNGIQDVPEIVKACIDAGTEWVIVENMEKEHYDDSLAATSISLRNLKKVMGR